MKRNRPLTSILAVVATTLVVAAIYFGVYFVAIDHNGPTRFYKSNWQRIFFTPAMKLESVFRGEKVTGTDSDNPFG